MLLYHFLEQQREKVEEARRTGGDAEAERVAASQAGAAIGWLNGLMSGFMAGALLGGPVGGVIGGIGGAIFGSGANKDQSFDDNKRSAGQLGVNVIRTALGGASQGKPR